MSALAPGDLAIVVRGHCHVMESQILGAIVTVAASPAPALMQCQSCMGIHASPRVFYVDDKINGRRLGVVPIHWLRKIEPLQEEGRTEHREKVLICK